MNNLNTLSTHNFNLLQGTEASASQLGTETYLDLSGVSELSPQKATYIARLALQIRKAGQSLHLIGCGQTIFRTLESLRIHRIAQIDMRATEEAQVQVGNRQQQNLRLAS